MRTALCFLQAARHSEIAELERLAHTTELVDATGDLIHGLQRERGLANRYLAATDNTPADWSNQIDACQPFERVVRLAFDRTPVAQAAHGARLYARMAYGIQGLDALTPLRGLIRERQLHHRQATEAYAQVIGGLLAVVFEAADSAADPAISRLLVALFNHLQGKEWAGQERAVGTALWASGRVDAESRLRLIHLIESQERCLAVFADFAPAEVLQGATRHPHPRFTAELERLRRVVLSAPEHGPLDPAVATAWFEACTQRIDGLKVVEDQLTQELVSLCRQKITVARQALAQLESWAAHPDTAPTRSALAFFEAAGSPARTSPTPPPEVERSILDLVHEQSHRLQAMEAELDTVRASLNERKRIERAKGVLMAHRRMTEEEAHRHLRQTAMDQGRRLVDVADALLTLANVLPGAPR